MEGGLSKLGRKGVAGRFGDLVVGRFGRFDWWIGGTVGDRFAAKSGAD